jgi:tetratricopeptide (TPR) repeat protein
LAESDPLLADVGRAIGMSHRGDRRGAQELLRRAWDRVGADGDALHRVSIAHSLADLQDDAEEELRWDLLALAAAEQLTDERSAAAGIGTPAAGFYPSLHLNLAEVYRKLGRIRESREHLQEGLAAAESLGWSDAAADGYQVMVTDALQRLGERLRPAEQGGG